MSVAFGCPLCGSTDRAHRPLINSGCVVGPCDHSWHTGMWERADLIGGWTDAEPDHECSICGCHLPAERVLSREERQRANDAERLLEEMVSMDAHEHDKWLSPDRARCHWCGEDWPCWTARVWDFLDRAPEKGESA